MREINALSLSYLCSKLFMELKHLIKIICKCNLTKTMVGHQFINVRFKRYVKLKNVIALRNYVTVLVTVFPLNELFAGNNGSFRLQESKQFLHSTSFTSLLNNQQFIFRIR